MAKSQYLIALGSNRRHYEFGRSDNVLLAALPYLENAGLLIISVSKVMWSRPIGPSNRNYANAAVVIESNLAPPALLTRLKQIEAQFGRRRGQRWSSRILDLDIILSSGGIFHSDSPSLCIPHPAMHERDFVLRPAVEIAPDWRDPITGLAIRHLAWRLKRAMPLDPKQKRP